MKATYQVDNTIKLSEARKVRAKKTLPSADWFQAARFGMFIHYGIWSWLQGRGEWSMYKDRIPKEKYNQLAAKFTAENFDVKALVGLAKRAGCGYAVLVARHHDGFCLWDTATTPFNSVRGAPAKRDFVREYVDACRREGLRVGIYQSVMSWQFQAAFIGPSEDPEGWEAMVQQLHDQVRELLTEYGQIDVLWYDGCIVPGCSDDSIRAKRWRTRELNAMARRLQPRILINDRSATAEDYSTPEQELTPAVRGRLWELNQTIGNYWAWHEDDVLKDTSELLNQLIFCARYGGNYLLNIAPRGDGLIPKGQVERMEAIGRWLALNGESIRNSERTLYTEAEHILGQVTARANKLYFHIANWPDLPALIAGIKPAILSVKLLASGQELKTQQTPDGTVTLLGLPPKPIDPYVTVVALELEKPVAQVKPPSLLIARETSRLEPAEAPVQKIEGLLGKRVHRFEFDAPAKGTYVLELGIIGRRSTRLTIVIGGKQIQGSYFLRCGHYPNTIRVQNLILNKGRHKLEISSAGGIDFDLYLWRLQPVWQPISIEKWQTMGPFPTAFRSQGTMDQVRAAIQTVFAPEQEKFDPKGLYPGRDGAMIAWHKTAARSLAVNFGRIYGEKAIGVCYARTVILSPEKRQVDILLGCDWWANLFVNRSLVKSDRDSVSVAKEGAWFSGWKPSPAKISFHEGENELLIKCHPGSINNWFTFWINNPGDLKIRP